MPFLFLVILKMKYDLENAIAQVKKYKRKVEKAKGAKKMLFKAHLAFWKSIRDELKDQESQQVNDNDDDEHPWPTNG